MDRLSEQLRQRHHVHVVVEGINLDVPGVAAELKSRLDRRDIARSYPFDCQPARLSRSTLAMLMETLPVATTGILAMLRRKTSVVAGILNKLVVFSNRLTPRPLQSLVMRKVMSG